MAKKTSSKRAFDWTTYSKPARLLTPSQEASLTNGLLKPFLDVVLSDDALLAQIRARQFVVYDRGANLMRIGGEGPFVAEFDVSFSKSREERGGEELERHEIVSDADVNTALERLGRLRHDFSAHFDAAHDTSDRLRKQAIFAANAGADLWTDEYVFVDLEYTYGRRRYDLVALHRTPGITGPGGFASPRLSFVHVQSPGQTLTGASGPASVAADLAEFVKAMSGEHLGRAREEIEALIEQKVRLGLLPDLDFRGLTAEMPELLVIFALEDVSTAQVDAAVIDVHDRLLSRHFPVERLRFAHLPEAGGQDVDTRLIEGDAMTYREFKEYRRS